MAAATLLAILALLAGLAALLAVPLELALQVRGLEPLRGGVAVRGMFGLLRWRFEWPRGAAPAPSKPAARRERRRDGAVTALRDPDFRQRSIRFARDLLDVVQVQDLRLQLRLGLGDPADMARLWAMVLPLQGMLRRLPGARVSIEPDFTEAALDFDGSGRLRLAPLRVLVLAIAFALAPSARRAWRTLGTGRA